MAQWNFPADLKYTKSDEWIRLEGDEAVVGVSDYAQSSLSTLTFVDLPKVGATFKAGEQFGAVESRVKLPTHRKAWTVKPLS